MPSPAPLDADACYLALAARDARFDGRFFTGVTSTGIYCRPVCRVSTPRQANCRFFAHAAQAEAAGFRPCLRCRPELAPGDLAWSTTDAGDILTRQALGLLATPDTWTGDTPSAAALAQRLGVSDRHLRRLFQERMGVSPLQYLQTRRLLTAKQLLTDSHLSVTKVAELSGFGSLRRFNAVFQERYGLNPSQLRRGSSSPESALTVRLGYRPPYDIAALLRFFHDRAIDGIEQVLWPTERMPLPGLTRTIGLHAPNRTLSGWVEARFDPERHQVIVRIAPSLVDALPTLIHRVRAWLDLDADPIAIQAVLRTMPAPAGEHAGLRVPGCLDGFELAVRAVLGQQITVAAARTLARRLVQQLGTPLPSSGEGDGTYLDRLFPSPQQLADTAPERLGELGIVRQRQRALIALAQAVCTQQLDLQGSGDMAATLDHLRQLPGIGEWTAQYIAMRALRWPDAFLAKDVALQKSLGLPRSLTEAAAESLSQAWRPWRSYAVMRAWQAPSPLSPPQPTP